MAARTSLRRPLTSLLNSGLNGNSSVIPKSPLPTALWSSRRGHEQRRGIAVAELDRLKGDRERVVILGAGWGGYVLSRHLDPNKYQVLVISPRSYFVFTPLLAGTTVGTLEFRNVIEPVRDRKLPHVHYMQAWADSVDLTAKTVRAEENLVDEAQKIAEAVARFKHLSDGNAQEVNVRQGVKWDVPYDKLVVAVGCYAQTFGTKGVKENAFFLKDARDARRIRTRLLECFELASLPTTSEETRRSLLHFAIVGGGPTGMEFSAELSDMVRNDMGRLYPYLKEYVKVTVYDVAPFVLGAFDKSLQQYAEKTFQREGVEIRTSHHVEELRPGLPRANDGSEVALKDSEGCYTIKTKEDGERGVGLCVWSTGLAQNPFVSNAVKELRRLPTRSLLQPEQNHGVAGEQQQQYRFKTHSKTHGLLVDDRFRVQLEDMPPKDEPSSSSSSSSDEHQVPRPPPHASKTVPIRDVFAIGDNASIAGVRLPATAQAANQQALWLARRLNRNDFDRGGFTFRNLGVMTYIGGSKALIQGGNGGNGNHGPRLKGRAAWIMWRGAYVTMAVSWRNKIVIPFYWALNWLFGRDISRF